MKKASAINAGTRLLVQLFLLALVIGSIFPLYNVIVASFKSGDEFVVNPFFPPKSPTSENFVYAAVNGSLLHYAVNSLILVPSGLLLYLAVCVSAGYAFGKMRFRLKRPLFLLVLFLTIFPQLLLATQVFKLISLLHLTNTGPGVILTWVAYFSPFGTYIMTTYFTDMPYELVEAARMDGASPLRILVQVMTPTRRAHDRHHRHHRLPVHVERIAVLAVNPSEPGVTDPHARHRHDEGGVRHWRANTERGPRHCHGSAPGHVPHFPAPRHTRCHRRRHQGVIR